MDGSTGLDIQTSRHLDIQTSRHPDIQTSRHPDIQTSRHPDIQISRHPDIQTSSLYIGSDTRADVKPGGHIEGVQTVLQTTDYSKSCHAWCNNRVSTNMDADLDPDYKKNRIRSEHLFKFELYIKISMLKFRSRSLFFDIRFHLGQT